MAAIPKLLGIGPGGANFSGTGAEINDPVSQAQLQQAYQNSQQGLAQQQGFLSALQGQNGIGNQNQVFQQQQALAQQLQGVANGTGPNPAQAQLAQATGANVANQAALMASQRGASQNAGLLARQAAQQGAGIQQQAAGQAATLQANQSLNAFGALQNQQAQMANLAGQQVGNQANALNSYNSAAQNEQGQLLNSVASANKTRVDSQSNLNTTNAGIQAPFAGAVPGTLAGLATGAGSAIASGSKAAAAHGGMMGDVAKAQGVNHVHQYLSGGGMSNGGKVPAIVSPGEAYISPGNVKAVAQGADPRQVGEVIPGKAKVKGDSRKNDTIPKDLDSGGVVIPRSVMNSKDPAKEAAKFVSAVLAKHNGMKNKKDK